MKTKLVREKLASKQYVYILMLTDMPFLTYLKEYL